MTKTETVPAQRLAQPVDLPLSVSVITLNEEANLGRCLESVCGIAREIVVVDSGSTDRTREIAESYGARFIHHDWPGHVEQKNFALEECVQPWVLSLDADEALDVSLRAAVMTTLREEPMAGGYYVNRLNWYLGDWIWHAWYPEWRLRLVRRETARWAGTNPHDKLKIEGTSWRLEGHLLHYSYRDMTHHLQQTLAYGRISGQQITGKGRGKLIAKLLFSPMWRFIRTLVIKSGWRDGWRGLVIAYTSMFSAFLKYAYAIDGIRRRDGGDEHKDTAKLERGE